MTTYKDQTPTEPQYPEPMLTEEDVAYLRVWNDALTPDRLGRPLKRSEEILQKIADSLPAK